MKQNFIGILIICALSLTGCNTARNSVAALWDNSKAFGEYVTAKSKALIGIENNDHALLASREDPLLPEEDEYIPLLDEDLKPQYTEVAAAQPSAAQELHIHKFQNPTQELAAIFKSVHFNTDDDKLRVKEYVHVIERIASYMKNHPELYVFVEGHCDDRASESYNRALGSRRANTIRNMLIKKGVSSDQIYTISYGKERPIAKGTTRSARFKNRRAEFKIFNSLNED